MTHHFATMTFDPGVGQLILIYSDIVQERYPHCDSRPSWVMHILYSGHGLIKTSIVVVACSLPSRTL